jgi:tripeptide aminopeptidase
MINSDRLVQTFIHLAQIDNPSGQEQAMAQAVLELLSTLGLQAEQDGKGNVIARLPGEGAPLLLSAHLDSVAPAVNKRPVITDGVISSAGDTVLGADDLAGVSAILEAVQTVMEKDTPHRAAELVFTVEEEIGLKGAKVLDYSTLTAKQGVALDLNGDVGGICIAAPAHDQITVTIKGRAAHAGVAPEDGINALIVAAEAIGHMPLGRIDHETTANLGTITGGAARNIVPEYISIIGEARSRNEAKLDQQVAAMRQAFEAAAQRHGATVEFQAERAYGPQLIPEDAPIVQLCQGAAQRAGLEPRLLESGGGSDVNIFNMNGIQAVNLSVGYQEIHSTKEHIAIADLEKTARLVYALLELE